MGTDDQELEHIVLGDGIVKEIRKNIKRDTIKELVCSFCCSVLVMKLAMLNENIREYLLSPPLSMQYAIEKQPTLLDALFTRKESNEY